MLFHFINNSFVHRLTLSFREKDRHLPYYMRENVDDLQCHIGALHIENSVYDRESCMAVNDNGEAEGIDYALADFLGEHLKPTV